MLKVCGVSFSHTANYGTSLQAYALQQAVRGIEIGGEGCEYSLLCLKDCADYPRPAFTLRRALGSVYINWIRGRFRRFEDSRIRFVRLTSLKDTPSLNDRFDCFVCGSDVIWNPAFNERVGAYYLDFAEKYAFSYAASFGRTDISDADLERFGPAIGRLRQVGIREGSAEALVRRCSGAPIRRVADPVLLLDAAQWDGVAGPAKPEAPYIFVYATHSTPVFDAFVSKLQKETGLPVKRAAWSTSLSVALRTGRFAVTTQPEWLRQLRDARYVVTNSFHATVFSVIWQKKFFTVVGGEKDQKANVRMYDFLTGLGLADRMYNETPGAVPTDAPDYASALPRLEALRADSLAFLRENLENACREKESADAR